MNKHEFVPNSRKLYVKTRCKGLNPINPVVGFDVETLQDGSLNVIPMALDVTDAEVYHITEGEIIDCEE